jgi:CBS domain-containing protein
MADTPGQTLPQSVEDLMTKDVLSCTPDDLLNDVLKTMTEGRFRHMPVLRDGNLCGVITIGDVVHFRLKELEYEALRMKQMIVG